MIRKIVLPCTACRCVSHCPQGLDIPTLLNFYNEHCFTGGEFIALKIVLGVKRFLLYLAFVMAFSLATGLLVNLIV